MGIRAPSAAAALAAAWLAAGGAARAAAPAPVVLKLGTLAQEGTPWYTMLERMDEEVRRASGGAVRFQLYPGGVVGDEPQLVEKMRIGQLQAAGLTLTGLSHVDPGGLVLQIPLLYDTLDELHAVRAAMTPALEADLAAKGFTVLCWTDVGWVYFFSRTPFTTLAQLRAMKMFLWAGDEWSGDLYAAARFQPVSLAMDDMLPALKTGMVDVFDTVPLVALSYQWFGLAPHLLDLKWVPVTGALVVTNAAWATVPAAARPAILAAARRAADRERPRIERLNAQAIEAMRGHGLTVTRLTAAQTEAWHREVEASWPKLRGLMGPARYFDRAIRLLVAYRRTTGSRAPLPPLPAGSATP